MPSHTKVFNRNFLILAGTFATVLVVLLVVGNIANTRFNDITDSLVKRDAYRYPKAAVERIRSLLGETELSLKAYTFTRNETFLDDYYLNCYEIIDEFDALEADSHLFEPAINNALDTLDTLVFTRLDLFESILTSGDEFRVERAMNRVNQAVKDYEDQPESEASIEDAAASEPKKRKGILGLLGVKSESEDEARLEPVAGVEIDSLQMNLSSIASKERYRETRIRNVMLELSEDGKKVSERIDEIISLIAAAEIDRKEKEARYAANLSEASKRAVRWGIAITIVLVISFTALLFFQIVNANRLATARKKASEKALSLASTKESFITNVSHELRTPLNSIIGFSELIEESKNQKERLDFTQKVKRSAYHLNDLIQDLLDWSKLESGKFSFEHKPFKVGYVVEEVGQMMAYKHKQSEIEFRVNAPLRNIEIIGDPVRLKQILINLLGNAFKFTESGFIEIEATDVPAGNDVIEYEFIVKDSGPGIPAEKVNLMFKDFEQIDQSFAKKHEGSGLGLAISERLVKEQGGEITIESELGKGTEVHVKLAYKINDEMTNSHRDVHDLKGKRILIVDDHAFNLDILAAYLQKGNCKIHRSTSAKEAQSIAKQEEIDIAILDLKMPEMDGFQLADELKALGKERLIMIALSAASSSEMTKKCHEHGFDAVLTKPVDQADLFSKLKLLLTKADNSSNPSSEVCDAQDEGEISIIDITQINQLFGDDLSFRNEMLNAFITSIEEEKKGLEEFVLKGEEEALEDVLHKLRPSCRQIGARQLLGALDALKLAVNKPKKERKAAIEAFKQRFKEVESHLLALIDKTESK